MSIEELKRQRQGSNRAPQKSQLPYALMILAGVIIIYVIFLRTFKFGHVIFFGLLVGYALQRSKFCFTASIRDMILFKKTKVLRAVILGMIVATVGFGMIQYGAINRGEPIPGQIAAVGLHTVIGGFMFGIGMVIAGGCVSGTFTRIGEGYLLQWITLGGMFIGTAISIVSFETWAQWFIQGAYPIYLGDYISMPLLIVLQVAALSGLVIWAYYFEKNRHK